MLGALVARWNRGPPSADAASRRRRRVCDGVKCSTWMRPRVTPRPIEPAANVLDHRARPAQEVLVDIRRIEQRAGELAHLGAVEAAVEDVDVLRLAAHDESTSEARAGSGP